MSKMFDFQIDLNGAVVIWVRDPLHSACLSDAEVESEIRYLKGDLDRVAILMKAAIRRQSGISLFDETDE